MFSLLPLGGSDAEWLQVHALGLCPVSTRLHHLPVFARQWCYTGNQYLLAVGSRALAFLSPGFLIYKISPRVLTSELL